VEKQIADTQKVVKSKTAEIVAQKAGMAQEKAKLQMLRPGTHDFLRQQNVISALETHLAVLQDALISEKSVRLIGLREKLTELQRKINIFYKQ
jgi:citrate lyase beta subunit